MALDGPVRAEMTPSWWSRPRSSRRPAAPDVRRLAPDEPATSPHSGRGAGCIADLRETAETTPGSPGGGALARLWPLKLTPALLRETSMCSCLADRRRGRLRLDPPAHRSCGNAFAVLRRRSAPRLPRHLATTRGLSSCSAGSTGRTAVRSVRHITLTFPPTVVMPGAIKVIAPNRLITMPAAYRSALRVRVNRPARRRAHPGSRTR